MTDNATTHQSADTPAAEEFSAEQLAEHTARLAEGTAEALALVGGTLVAGPVDPQDGVEDLLPEGAVHGVVARVRESPVVQLVLVISDDYASTQLSAGDGSADLPEPWMGPVASTMERWASELGGAVVSAMPATDANQLRHLLIEATDTTLMAAGLFNGNDLVGSVAVVGRTGDPEDAAQGGAGSTMATPNEGSFTSGVEALLGERERVATERSTSSPAGSAPTEETSANPNIEAMHVLAEVEMTVTAELGRTRMTVSDLLALAPGSLIELDRTAGSPIDLLVNGTLIARGEVVVVDEEYGIRLTEISGSES